MNKEFSSHFPTVYFISFLGENKEDDTNESRYRKTFKFNPTSFM